RRQLQTTPRARQGRLAAPPLSARPRRRGGIHPAARLTPYIGGMSKLRDGTRLTFRTLAMVWRGSPAATTILGVLTLASAMLPVAIAVAGKGIVDAVVARSTAAAIRWVLIELGVVATQALVQRGLG